MAPPPHQDCGGPGALSCIPIPTSQRLTELRFRDIYPPPPFSKGQRSPFPFLSVGPAQLTTGRPTSRGSVDDSTYRDCFGFGIEPRSGGLGFRPWEPLGTVTASGAGFQSWAWLRSGGLGFRPQGPLGTARASGAAFHAGGRRGSPREWVWHPLAFPSRMLDTWLRKGISRSGTIF